MGQFSQKMQGTVQSLCERLGNACILTKVTAGVYNTTTGETANTTATINTHSVPLSIATEAFGSNGVNTNLSGFGSERVIIPYPSQEVDATWLYDGYNILDVATTKAQDEIIMYTISIGEKM